MRVISLLSLATLPLAFTQNYQVPDLEYNNDEPTCDTINTLIAATSSDITRLTNYVSITLPARSSKLNDVFASVKKTCGIIQSKRPSLIQTSDLRVENLKTLEKLSSQVMLIANSVDFEKESHTMFRSLVHLNMNSIAPSDLCNEVFESVVDLKNYLRFLGPAITEKYIDGILADRLNNLQSFNTKCIADSCENGGEDSDHDEEDSHQGHVTDEETDGGHFEEETTDHVEEDSHEGHVTDEETDSGHFEEETEESDDHVEEDSHEGHVTDEETDSGHLEEETTDHIEEDSHEGHVTDEETDSGHLEEETEDSDDIVEEETTEEEESPEDNGYTFYPTLDSRGGDITQLQGYSVKNLKKWCTANAECLGFNTNGVAKSSFETKDAWVQWTENPNLGLWVKNSVAIDTYRFYPYQDSRQSDITQLKGYSVEGLKAYCSARADCKGFNTEGYIKKSIRPMNEWNKETCETNFGLYIKETVPRKIYDYDVYAQLDSKGSDIKQLTTSYDVDDLKKACDLNPDCKAFNSEGWIKDTVKATNKFNSHPDPVNFALYVKKDVKTEVSYKLENYAFYPSQDSDGNDLIRLKGKTIAELKAYCDANSECQGFNTDGYMKKAIKSFGKWAKETSSDNYGLYVKGGVSTKVNDYTFYAQKDSKGNDIVQLTGGYSVEDLKNVCDANPDCKGFNTAGWIKDTIKPVSQFAKKTDPVNFGTYVKNS